VLLQPGFEQTPQALADEVVIFQQVSGYPFVFVSFPTSFL